jgi:hypothetical protein
MISPHTAPGTAVVALVTDRDGLIHKGRVYFVEEIELLAVLGGFVHLPVAHLKGVICKCRTHPANIPLEMLDYAQLPKALTDLLASTPADLPEEVEA